MTEEEGLNVATVAVKENRPVTFESERLVLDLIHVKVLQLQQRYPTSIEVSIQLFLDCVHIFLENGFGFRMIRRG